MTRRTGNIDGNACQRVLTRAGGVLLAVVLVEALLSLSRGRLPVPVVGAAAAVLLFRGGLRTASLVRWLSVFGLFAAGVMLLGSLVLEPLDLAVARLRLEPVKTIVMLGGSVLSLLLLGWLVKVLGDPAILAAREAAGRPRRSMLVPAAVGCAVAAAFIAPQFVFFRSAAATQAKHLAELKLGPGYRYAVERIGSGVLHTGVPVDVVVAAWDATSIRRVPLTVRLPSDVRDGVIHDWDAGVEVTLRVDAIFASGEKRTVVVKSGAGVPLNTPVGMPNDLVVLSGYCRPTVSGEFVVDLEVKGTAGQGGSGWTWDVPAVRLRPQESQTFKESTTPDAADDDRIRELTVAVQSVGERRGR